MAETLAQKVVRHTGGAKFNLHRLTDAELDTIITNAQAQIASLTRFLERMTAERARRQP